MLQGWLAVGFLLPLLCESWDRLPASGNWSSGVGPASVPNILFLLADQHRFDAVGSGASTPNLDRLARDGAKFIAHYSSTPTCTPARSAILTGRSPWNHGMLGYGEMAPRYGEEMPEKMAALGLRTVVIGKNHYGWNQPQTRPLERGFSFAQIYDGLGSGMPGAQDYDDYDHWFQQHEPGENPLKSGGLGWNTWRGAKYEFAEDLHPTAWTGRLAREEIQKLGATKQPFFMKVSFHRPHSPYDPPARLLDATPSPAQSPATADGGWDAHFKHCSERGTEVAWCGEVGDADLDLARRAYLASVSFVDEQIGGILKALEDAGVSDNTFVIYTSDHGDMQMDHFLWRKGYPYEASAHVPLFVKWPASLDSKYKLPRGSEISAITELRDIFPTFLDVLGHWDTSSDFKYDGRPLTAFLSNSEGKPSLDQPWRQWIDLEHDVVYSPEIHWSALTDGKMKFIYFASGKEQLFNITADPYEKFDLAKDQHFAIEKELWRSRMVKQFQDEGRGENWVQDGQLVAGRKSCPYSPHFPMKVENCKVVPHATLLPSHGLKAVQRHRAHL